MDIVRKSIHAICLIYIYIGSVFFQPSLAAEGDDQCKEMDKTPLTVAGINNKISECAKKIENAKTAESKEKAAKNAEEAATKLARLRDAVKQKESFLGLNWALGLAFVSVNQETIDKAEVINGVVTVLDTHKRTESLMFETHYTTGFDDDDSIADGPFVSIELSDNNGDEFKAYGFGWMWSFQFDQESKKAVNIGVGYYVNREIVGLAAGFIDGQPLPSYATEIKYREEDSNGWMLMLSHTFW